KSTASDQAIGGDGRRRRTLRDGKLPAAEERFRRGGRRIWESTGKQSKIGGADLRHRGLRREARPAGAVAYGRGHGRAISGRRPEGKVLPRGCAGLEEGKLGESRTITGGIREKSADAIGIPASSRGARVARASVWEPEQD